MTIVRDLDLSNVRLLHGAHPPNTDEEWCVMEAVAWVAGEPWTDHPKCASTVLGAFCRSFNDNLDDEGRQRLAPYIPKLVGTNTGARRRGPASMKDSGFELLDQLIAIGRDSELEGASS